MRRSPATTIRCISTTRSPTSIGLAAPPVHGMKLLAAFEPMLAAWRDDLVLARLSAKFIQPVLRGETVTLSGRVLPIVARGDGVFRAGFSPMARRVRRRSSREALPFTAAQAVK